MQATITPIPHAQRRGRPASFSQAQADQVLPPVADSDVAETTRLTFDEIEQLLLRIHGRTDAIKALAGLTGAGNGSLDISRDQLVALLDVLTEGVKVVAYEMQETVGAARRQLGMYRQPQFGCS